MTTEAPQLATPNAAARAAPPAPKIAILLPRRFPSPPARRIAFASASTTPSASVFRAKSLPLEDFPIVFAAPMRCALSSIIPPDSFTNRIAFSLCGILTAAPQKSSGACPNNSASVALKGSHDGATPIAKRRALKFAARNQRL